MDIAAWAWQLELIAILKKEVTRFNLQYSCDSPLAVFYDGRLVVLSAVACL